MGPVIGDFLPAAIGVAISPIPIIAVILMLLTPRARTNGPAFLVGWIVALLVGRRDRVVDRGQGQRVQRCRPGTFASPS